MHNINPEGQYMNANVGHNTEKVCILDAGAQYGKVSYLYMVFLKVADKIPNA